MRLKYIILLSILFATSQLFAQSVKELSKQKAKAEKEIAFIDSLLLQTGSKKAEALQELNLINAKIRHRRDIISTTDLQIGITTREIKQSQDKIKGLNKHLEQLKDSYAGLLSALYTKRRNSTWLMYVLASDDLAQAYRRLRYFRSFADLAISQASAIKQSTKDLEATIAELEQQKNQLRDFQKQKQAEVMSLATEEEKARTLKKGLEKKERELKASLRDKQRALANLNTEIERILAEEMKKSAGTSKAAGSSNLPVVDKALSAKFENNKGNLPWPLRQGAIAERFGNNAHPVFKHIQLPPNRGIDISTNAGATVHAVFTGKVSRVFPIAGMGTGIIIQHGEYFTVYVRLTAVQVKSGDTVQTGDAIAKVDTPATGTPTLHFELWKDKTYMNPELWLKQK